MTEAALEIYPFDFPDVGLGRMSWQAARNKAGDRGERYVTGYLGEIVVATTFNFRFVQWRTSLTSILWPATATRST